MTSKTMFMLLFTLAVHSAWAQAVPPAAAPALDAWAAVPATGVRGHKPILLACTTHLDTAMTSLDLLDALLNHPPTHRAASLRCTR
jgi:hypothetical protein